MRALRASDLTTARAAVERAANAWPTQPTYLWGRAFIAAQSGDTAGTARALGAYADLGLGRELGDTVFDRYRALPWFSRVSAAHAANRAPVVRSRVAATLADSDYWPEGMDVDPQSRTVYVTSVRLGEVRAIDTAGRSRTVWPRPGAKSEGAALAVRLDPRRDRLWLTVSAMPAWSGHVPGDSSASLVELPLGAGDIRRWRLAPGNHTLGDVAVAANGDVLFSDSGEPVLYRLSPGTDSLRAYRHALFRSLQGIAIAPGGRDAYVADYSHGILRVRLDDGSVTRVSDAPGVTSLGIDGLNWGDNALIAVQNGVSPARIVRFDLSADGASITAARVLDRRPDADEPTIGAVAADEFWYIGTSQWEKRASDGKLLPNAKTAPVLIFAVPLANPHIMP